MKKTLITLAIAALAATAAQAADAPLWLRNARISPNGQEIAFTYKGDLYKVGVNGGQAVQLTTQGSYETAPVWSPDGRQLAFASDRKGNFDVFVMPSTGGTPRQLTYNSASETPLCFSADGKYVFFDAQIQDPAQSGMFPTGRLSELYKVPVAGGRTTQVLAVPVKDMSLTADGKLMVYQDLKGMEDTWRKHHTSAVTRDIWSYDFSTGKHTNLTAHAGEDIYPVVSKDGQTVYWLSERNGGTMNVYKASISDMQHPTALTSFTKNPVRFLSRSNDGKLCYTYDSEIFVQDNDGAQPRKVNISLWHDDGDSVANLTYTRGATSAAVSPDGKQVAFVVRGDVFVTSVAYGTTKQVTATPQGEKDVAWGPDNRTLYYSSERTGAWQLWKATIGRKDDPNFANATTIKETQLTNDSKYDYTQPQVSPNGKQLAYVQDGEKLMVMDLKSKASHQVTDGSQWFGTEGAFDYDWSPDGKWFAIQFIGNGRDPYSDIGIVSAQGGKITNITNSAYINVAPQWTLDGGAIMFLSNRYGMRSQASWGSQDDVLMAFVNEEAYDRYRLDKENYELLQEAEKAEKKAAAAAEEKAGKGKKGKKADKKADDAKKDEAVKDIEVQLDKIQDRIVRVTPNSSSLASAIMTKDGNSLYYLSQFEGGYDLWKMDMRKKSTKLINKMNTRWASLQAAKDGKTFFILGGSTMNKLETGSDKLTPITYSAKMKMNLAAERRYMYDHMAREVGRRFYRADMHGCDWQWVTNHYRKFLPHITNNYDYANLLSETLGELNCSHSGGRYYPSGGEATAQLGLLFDWTYTGQGLKVDEVLEYGPFDRQKSKVRPGTIITKINGQEITPENDYTQLLNGQAGRKTLVTCQQGGNTWEEVVIPASKSKINAILYDRWVKHNERLVDSLSHGRLGYVHLQQMNDNSYRTVYDKVLGKYNRREGIVIDTRWNGGGRLHEDIQILFSGEKYLTQVVRGRETCDMPSRRWNKPSIMLQCEANYSNAHGTPWVYKHTDMGKLVGMPVPGTMSSVDWETLQDPTLIFGEPIIGYRLPDGSYLENKQLEPDIKVANDPSKIVKGQDEQLEAAVSELLREIDGK